MFVGSMPILGIAILLQIGSLAFPPLFYVALGGVFSGFVATLGKTVILRVEDMFSGGRFHFGSETLLTLVCVLGIGVASGLSIFFVQYSHTCNSPDVVIAGLTVIDPALAVVLGITILQEAAGAPMWSSFAFIVAGAVAVLGVLRLARAEGSLDGGGTDPSAPPPSTSEAPTGGRA